MRASRRDEKGGAIVVGGRVAPAVCTCGGPGYRMQMRRTRRSDDVHREGEAISVIAAVRHMTSVPFEWLQGKRAKLKRQSISLAATLDRISRLG